MLDPVDASMAEPFSALPPSPPSEMSSSPELSVHTKPPHNDQGGSSGHIDCDSWIDDWDYVIRRCATCNRPFTTEQRLKAHVDEYHGTPYAKTLPAYRPISQLRETTNLGEGLERVDIVPSGDLEIVTSATVIRVASQVLWTASPVFNAMFGPSSTYTEARKLKLATLEPDTRAVITVDDDATALGAVLQVLHHRPVTSDFTFEELVKITEVTDKYQVAHVVKHKMERWVEKFDSGVLKSGYEDALTIAWVFKIDELFQKMTKELGSRTVFDQNGQLSLTDTSGQIIKFSDTLPEIVLVEIAKKKSQSTDSLRMAIETLQGDRTDTSGQKFRHCMHSNIHQAKHKECCYMNSGYLLATISELRLNNDETWKGDVKQLLESLRTLEVLTVPYNGYNYHHSNCSWVPQIQSKALGAVKFDMTLKLSDFPSRIES